MRTTSTSRRPLLAAALWLALAPVSTGAWGSAPAKSVQAPQKANGSGIDVSYRLEGEPAAGRATRIVIVLSGVTDAAQAFVRFAADPELKLEGAGAAATRLPADRPSTLTLTVTPQSDGLRYLNVFTSQHGVTGATAIPVQAGDAAPAAAPSGKLGSTPKGDKVLSLPVK
jgi:hypothetical protein